MEDFNHQNSRSFRGWGSSIRV